MSLNHLLIDKSWTLFLDRDGVINKRLQGDYVKRWEEFEFLPDVKESIAKLSDLFGIVVVVTNQQGISKGLYTESDLEGIHLSMMLEIMLAGGQIDRVYFAPQLASENNHMRKPNTGMAEKAKDDFPSIDFSRSLMVGDSISDMEFGKRAGMKTVFLSKEKMEDEHSNLIDFQFKDWKELIKAIQ